MVRKNLVFDFQYGVYGESVADISAVEALDFVWALDEAPSMDLRISNLGSRRENYFTPHSTWNAYVGLGALPASPIFIGYQSPFDAPEYDEETLRLTVYGYTARMREMMVAVDQYSWAGMDAMAAIKDNFDSLGTSFPLTTAGLTGAATPSAVPVGAVAKAPTVMDRTSVIKALLPYAQDVSDPDRPLPLHYLETPNGTVATVIQKTGLDPTSNSPAVAAVLTQGTDFYRIRRQYDQTMFTAAYYKYGDGLFGEVDYGANNMVKVHSQTIYDDRESARRAVQLARIPKFTYEVDLTTWSLDLTPGAVVQITGTKGPADGYHQIAELRMNFRPGGYGMTARMAAKAPL